MGPATESTGLPRLRHDLRVTPLQDADGVSYYDVSDPGTGGVLRLYDFEWLVAERIDGQHGLDELVRWTREVLGIDVSAEDLRTYVGRLGALGFFDATAI